MAYSTGTASSMNDLMSQLSTFCVAQGYTEDQYQAASGTSTHGKLSLHKGTVYVHFSWNPNLSTSVMLYQSLGFISSGTNIWQHTDDSGAGYPGVPTATWDGSNSHYYRSIRAIGNGPYTSYAFFGGTDYIHVALEYSPATYRHFGFGILEKSWSWTGGEYAYAHNPVQQFSSSNSRAVLLPSDEITSSSNTQYNPRATIHAEGLPGETVAQKWGTFMPRATGLTSYAVDRAGEYQRIFWGGCPGGLVGYMFGTKPANSGDGFLPLTANAVFYRNTAAAPDAVYFMGHQPDVRSLNMRNYSPKDEITIAGDTWVIFPAVRKQFLGIVEESRNFGVAYKKIVT